MQTLSKWTATKLRTRDAIVLAIASAFCLGCSSGEVAQRTVNPGVISVSGDSVKQVVAIASQVESTDAIPSVPEDALPEFPEDVNFFKLPKPVAVRHEVVANVSKEQKSIRLLGFINPNPSDAAQTLALLKIGGRLVNLRMGEKLEEIELLSIDDRSVTLQWQRDRWTLAMMDQPVVNQAVAQPEPRLRRRSSAESYSSPSLPSFRPTPIVDALMPEPPVLPGVGAEADPFSPPMEPPTPELPDTSDLPGI